MRDDKAILFICEKYYLRFYRPLAAHLAGSGFKPIWIALDGIDRWDHDYLDARSAVDTLVESDEMAYPPGVDMLCAFEQAVFDRPSLFKANYSYTVNVVRTLERARRLAAAWYEFT